MNNKYWSKLLAGWRRKGRDGLTLPYIIGSQNFLSLEHESQGIGDFIIDVVESDEAIVYLKYCLTTEDIVFGIKDDTKANLVGSFPLYEGVVQSNLFLTSFLDDLGKDVETIIRSLEDRYQSFIAREEYSKYNRERGYYTSEEVAFIRSCFKSCD